MYSGTTLTTFSGRILGAHQKIDRVARVHLETLLPGTQFPPIKRILYFEGGNGPDAIKRKSPGKNEPWHYIQPFNDADTSLLDIIEDHFTHLTVALRAADEVRAAFEAAWLSHAIVDGLTPAHHYPYEEKLTELRGGLELETRDSVKNKIVLPGITKRAQVRNNWKMWGPKGLFTTHSAFEWGVATLIAPLNFKACLPSETEIITSEKQGIRKTFLLVAQKIANDNYYERFYKDGWNLPLAREVRSTLAPEIVKAVTLSWCLAARAADETKTIKRAKR